MCESEKGGKEGFVLARCEDAFVCRLESFSASSDGCPEIGSGDDEVCRVFSEFGAFVECFVCTFLHAGGSVWFVLDASEEDAFGVFGVEGVEDDRGGAFDHDDDFGVGELEIVEPVFDFAWVAWTHVPAFPEFAGECDGAHDDSCLE